MSSLVWSFQDTRSPPQEEFDRLMYDLTSPLKRYLLLRKLDQAVEVEPSRHILRYLSDFKDIHRGALRGQLKDTKTLRYEEKQYRERKRKGYKHFHRYWTGMYQYLRPRINREDVRAWGVEGLQFKRGFKGQDIPGWELIFRREKQRIYRRTHDGAISRWPRPGMSDFNDI